MTFVTDFADQAVILPLVLVVTIMLAASLWWRGTLAWVVSVGGTLAAIGAGKLLLAACGPVQFGDVLQSPSGHTASATIVYGGLFCLLWRRMRPADLRTPLVAALMIALLIGISRVVLRTHTWPEVLVGGIAGTVGVGVLMALAGPVPAHIRPIRAALIVVGAVAVMHGTHLRAEPTLQDWGKRLAWLLPGCAPSTTWAATRADIRIGP